MLMAARDLYNFGSYGLDLRREFLLIPVSWSISLRRPPICFLAREKQRTLIIQA
jgi:hypothetical protein